MIITGQGKAILTDKDREITFMRVEDETLYVEPSHLLACEETLTPRYVPLDEQQPGIEFLALEGSGMVALSVASKPLPLEVTPDLPVSVPAASVICWTGALMPHVVEDRHLFEVMLPPPGAPAPLIRLEGNGRVLVEQTTSTVRTECSEQSSGPAPDGKQFTRRWLLLPKSPGPRRFVGPW